MQCGIVHFASLKTTDRRKIAESWGGKVGRKEEEKKTWENARTLLDRLLRWVPVVIISFILCLALLVFRWGLDSPCSLLLGRLSPKQHFERVRGFLSWFRGYWITKQLFLHLTSMMWLTVLLNSTESERLKREGKLLVQNLSTLLRI